MTQNRKKISFEQQEVYVGIDVHKKHWTIVVCTEHREYRPYNISPPCVEVLINRIQKDFPNADFICAYEAGFSGFGLCEQLLESGIQCLVINAADIPTTDREAEFKTDQRDTSKIAKSLRSGQLNSMHIPPKQLQGDRSLVRLHDQFKRDVIRQKCRIKMHLYYFGVKIPAEYDDKGRWSRPYISWLFNLKMSAHYATVMLQHQMGQFIYVLGMKRNSEAWLRQLSKSEPYRTSFF